MDRYLLRHGASVIPSVTPLGSRPQGGRPSKRAFGGSAIETPTVAPSSAVSARGRAKQPKSHAELTQPFSYLHAARSQVLRLVPVGLGASRISFRATVICRNRLA